MFRSECPICEHLNPAESRFCNACGAPLHLAPCPHCGAINSLDASECYKCGVGLARRSADAPPTRGPNPGAGGRSHLAAAAATRPIESLPHPSRGSAAPDHVPAAVEDPQEMLRELERMLAIPIEGVAANEPEPMGSGAQTNHVPPDRAIGHKEAAPPPARPALPGRARSAGWPGSGAIVWLVGAAVLAGAGYYAYRYHATSIVTQVPATSPEATKPGGPAGGGAIVNQETDPARQVPAASASDRSGLPAAANGQATVSGFERNVAKVGEREPSGGDPPGDARGAKDAPAGIEEKAANATSATATKGSEVPPRAARNGAARAQDAAAAAAVLVPQPPGAGTRIEPPPPRLLGQCTENVAALGLCAPEATQRRE